MNTSVIATGSNIVVVSWSSPISASQCIDYYVVNIVTENETSQKNTSDNSTTLDVSVIQGMNYSFSVTGVDRAERTGGESETANINVDGKCI